MGKPLKGNVESRGGGFDKVFYQPQSSPPPNPSRGDEYYDDNTNRKWIHNGSVWIRQAIYDEVTSINNKVDRQHYKQTSSLNTSSTTLVDIPGFALTTGNLNENGRYYVNFNVNIFSNIQYGARITFALLVNGIQQMDARREIYLTYLTGNVDLIESTTAYLENIGSGTVIKMQWSISIGTLTLTRGNFSIDGIPNSSLI